MKYGSARSVKSVSVFPSRSLPSQRQTASCVKRVLTNDCDVMTAHANALLRVEGGSAGRSKQCVVGLLAALGLGGHAAFDGGGGQGVAHGLPCMAAQRIARHAGRAACSRARYGALGDVCRLAHRSLRGSGDELTLVKAKSQIRRM